MALKKGEDKEYVSILADGTLRLPVPEGTEGAVTREYETSDGKKGVKHELVFKSLEGKITNVSFFEGEFGKLIQLEITDDAGSFTLSVNTSLNFGEDILKKLPAIDLSKDVEITPYSFEDEKGKSKKGVTITQDGVKITNFFYDVDSKKTLHKYPEVSKADSKKYDKDDWKMFFMKARKFLVKYTEDNIIKKHFADKQPVKNESEDDDDMVQDALDKFND